MTCDFQAMLDSNITIQQHNAVVAMRDAKPDYNTAVWAQMIAGRTDLNIFNEGLEVA
jgi:hypothetical protein